MQGLRQRSIAATVILGIVTFGIYGAVLIGAVQREAAQRHDGRKAGVLYGFLIASSVLMIAAMVGFAAGIGGLIATDLDGGEPEPATFVGFIVGELLFIFASMVTTALWVVGLYLAHDALTHAMEAAGLKPLWHAAVTALPVVAMPFWAFVGIGVVQHDVNRLVAAP